MLIATGHCLAADPAVIDEVVVESGYDWSGIYVGAQAGYAWGNAFADYSDFPEGQYAWNIDPDGIVGGIYAGANWQMSNRLVIGAESELNWSDVSGTGTYIEDYALQYPGYFDMEARLNWSGSTRLRLGYAIDRWMPYVTGGIAYAGYEIGLHDEAEGEGNLYGYTLGGGVEYAVTNSFRARLSYLYTDYDDDGFSAYYTGGNYGPLDIDFDNHAMQVGISYNW